MENYTVVNKGIIALSDKVMVSDPCYGLNTWCQGVVENVCPGEYECKVGFSDEDIFGTRVADIEVVHKGYVGQFLDYRAEEFEIGVDSGTAGIFDYEYYKKYHTDRSEAEHVNEWWYHRTGNLTFVTKDNPNYVEFPWDDNAEDMPAQYHKFREWTRDPMKSWPTIQCFDGNTIDGLGLVSSSGYGDGGYTCWTAKNDEGKVIAIRVEFIGEYDEDEEYE